MDCIIGLSKWEILQLPFQIFNVLKDEILPLKTKYLVFLYVGVVLREK